MNLALAWLDPHLSACTVFAILRLSLTPKRQCLFLRAGAWLCQANARRRAAAEHKTHKQLRIVGGALAGKRILSGRGETTRPMMEKVSLLLNMTVNQQCWQLHVMLTATARNTLRTAPGWFWISGFSIIHNLLVVG